MSERADALAERIFGSLLGTMEVFTIYLGDRLGLYAALAEGAATSADLASRAGIAERYAREWLEQQAVNGFVEVDDASAAAPASAGTRCRPSTPRCSSTAMPSPTCRRSREPWSRPASRCRP